MQYKQTYFSPLPETAAFEELLDVLKKQGGPILAGGCVESQKVDLMQMLGRSAQEKNGASWQVVVTYNELRAKEIYEDYRLFTDSVYLFPGKDVIFFQSDLQGKQILRNRLSVLEAIGDPKREGGVIVTTTRAMMNVMGDPGALFSAALTIRVGDEVSYPELAEKLVLLGYEKTGQVESPGQFAIRGGIMDVYSLTAEYPIRMELWGDEIDSLRSFDTESQRAVLTLEETRIFPATEFVLTDAQLKKGLTAVQAEADAAAPGSVGRDDALRFIEQMEYLPAFAVMDAYIPFFLKKKLHFSDFFQEEDVQWIIDEAQLVGESATGIETEYLESVKNRLEKGYLLPGQTGLLHEKKSVFRRLYGPRTVCVSTLDSAPKGLIRHVVSFHVQTIHTYKNGQEILFKDLQKYHKDKFRVVLLCGSKTRAMRLADQLSQEELLAYYKEAPTEQVYPGEICVTVGSLHGGFAYPQVQFVLITESDMVREQRKVKRKQTQYKGKKISDLSQLSIGDYVVHEKYGLGIYRGISRQEDQGVLRDYIQITYDQGGQLYVLMQNLDQIMKYSGGGDGEHKPKLNKLGNVTAWKKTRQKVQTHVENLARELVLLYHARDNGSGYAYGPDTVWQKEFEEMFPYEETPDQLEAIEQTKADMESPKIMDRLICGDVGYGKTEVALRAAFKAVQDGKQVAYLVPTTILASQHFATFKQRLKDYPVRVDMLSRFCTPLQVKDTLTNLKKGLVDIVIGTHRILSSDVQFKDLGLLVIDEEQRFGVAHKERIKQMKQQVDVLTLTATPIPRTLHMSLIGVRDMSVLTQAPSDRVPIQTYVCEYQDELVREAINRELARDGQVYYVYNRVQDIDTFTDGIRKLVPDASVAYAHGQMPKAALEQIMMDFINGEIKVLVSTTIIETGLDISNVNTIIIHDSDRFGLSQLYQLRGRVGRSNRMAYAFIMYRRDKILKEEAQKRLQAIREFTELGSGVKIALRDLEIRGAGNLLGAEQSGHMQEVGYDLYCKMLSEAVEALAAENGEVVAAPRIPSFETTVNFMIEAYIPEEYIHNESTRLEVYKKIATIEGDEDCMDMQDELTDRFGDIPQPVLLLLEIAKVKALAHAAYIEELSGNALQLKAKLFTEGPAIDGMKATEVLSENRRTMKYVGGKNPFFVWEPQKKVKMSPEEILQEAKTFIDAINCLLEPTA